jgi:transcriptional regulator GlxA family with amidase domain
VQATGDLDSLRHCDLVLVCAGIDVRSATDEQVRQTLRHLAAQNIPLGALCTGSHALASAGLLDGYRCAVHWENLAAMREEFPAVRWAQAVFMIDRDRYTCSGGTAPLDMALHIIREHHGPQLATQISEQFILERQRATTDHQRMPQPECIGPGYQHLSEAADIMAANIEEPLSLQEIANAIQLSLRQLERLFHRYYSMNPAQYYMNLRLRRARELLTHSAMPIMQITIACGFQSSSHFCKAYRSLFGHPPSDERRISILSGKARKSMHRSREQALPAQAAA